MPDEIHATRGESIKSSIRVSMVCEDSSSHLNAEPLTVDFHFDRVGSDLHDRRTVDDGSLGFVAGDRDRLAIALAFQTDSLVAFLPSIAGQPPGEQINLEFAVAAGDYLGGELLLLVFARAG